MLLAVIVSPAAAAATAAPAPGAAEASGGARSAFGNGIPSSKSAWPFDQIKGKRTREAEAAEAAAAALEDDDDESEAVAVGDDGSVPMKRATKAPPPKPVELKEYADTNGKVHPHHDLPLKKSPPQCIRALSRRQIYPTVDASNTRFTHTSLGFRV
jgi:hypothetical protein